jgi:hypothetical protein
MDPGRDASLRGPIDEVPNFGEPNADFSISRRPELADGKVDR